MGRGCYLIDNVGLPYGLKKAIEGICAVRQFRLMSISLPLDKIDDELWGFKSTNDNKGVSVFISFFSHGESDLDCSNAFLTINIFS